MLRSSSASNNFARCARVTAPSVEGEGLTATATARTQDFFLAKRFELPLE